MFTYKIGDDRCMHMYVAVQYRWEKKNITLILDV